MPGFAKLLEQQLWFSMFGVYGKCPVFVRNLFCILLLFVAFFGVPYTKFYLIKFSCLKKKKMTRVY